MIEAVIFDMDGTLIDTEMLWVKALEDYLRDAGSPLTHEETAAIVFGRSWHDIYRVITRRCPGVTASMAEMERDLAWRFEAQKDGVDIRIHASIECLHKLAAACPICIVSGSSRREIEKAVALMGIGDCVAFFLGAEDYAPGKPDPTCFIQAAAKLGVRPENCLVFEDSAAGVSAAKAAGMRCIALKRAGMPAQDLAAADLIVDSLSKCSLSNLG